MGRDYFDDDTYSSRDCGSSLSSFYFSSAFVTNYDKNHKEGIDVYICENSAAVWNAIKTLHS